MEAGRGSRELFKRQNRVNAVLFWAFLDFGWALWPPSAAGHSMTSSVGQRKGHFRKQKGSSRTEGVEFCKCCGRISCVSGLLPESDDGYRGLGVPVTKAETASVTLPDVETSKDRLEVVKLDASLDENRAKLEELQ